MTDQNTRTRFAPSPTGFMHVGAARTALFAWLQAKKDNGKFILRIEDTDKEREVEGSIQHIIKSLKWLGISWDEGVDIGGPYASYKQSDRLDLYKQWAEKLIAEGRAYADPYSREELENFRNQAKAQKKPFLYREFRPETPPVWDGSQPLRFKSDPKDYTWTDAVMGELHTGPEAIDDFIIIKSDGYPTYNFCHIIDDMLMEVSHVLRSQEFISSTPKFLNLYEALHIEHPVLATLPFVMAMDGKKKLGKRDGAKDILDYQSEGYLPEAMMNFLATLGWNDGTEQEIFTPTELIDKFSLGRVQKSPARFDEQRLLWLNGQHIRALSLDDLYDRVSGFDASVSDHLQPKSGQTSGLLSDVERSRSEIEGSKVTSFWPASAANADESRKKQILALVQDRLKTLADLSTLTDYFFAEPEINWSMIADNKQLSKLSKDEITNLLQTSLDELSRSDFDPEAIQNTLNSLLEITGQKPGILFSLIRIAVSWAPFSPALNDTLAVIGKDDSLSRISNAIHANS